MGRIADSIDNLRYDHPGLFRLLMVVTVSMGLFICFMLLPDSPVFRAVGITGLQKRISATNSAIYWSVRAMMAASSSDAPQTLYGSIEGIGTDGQLIATVAKGDSWTRVQLALADTKIVDLYGVAQLVGSLRMEQARFDIYSGSQAVVWLRKVPFNVKLIEAGVAIPDPNPPTNIVDTAFATYYWGLVKGSSL